MYTVCALSWFIMVWCRWVLSLYSTITSQTLGRSHDCFITSGGTRLNMGKCITRIYNKRKIFVYLSTNILFVLWYANDFLIHAASIIKYHPKTNSKHTTGCSDILKVVSHATNQEVSFSGNTSLTSSKYRTNRLVHTSTRKKERTIFFFYMF